MKRRVAKSKGEKERNTHLNAEFQRIARRNKKVFFSDHAKKLRKPIEWERLKISSRKLEIPREHSMQNGYNKGQKRYGPNRSRRYQKKVERMYRITIQKKISMTQVAMMV